MLAVILLVLATWAESLWVQSLLIYRVRTNQRNLAAFRGKTTVSCKVMNNDLQSPDRIRKSKSSLIKNAVLATKFRSERGKALQSKIRSKQHVASGDTLTTIKDLDDDVPKLSSIGRILDSTIKRSGNLSLLRRVATIEAKRQLETEATEAVFPIGGKHITIAQYTHYISFRCWLLPTLLPTGKKKITVNMFKDILLVDIREFYTNAWREDKPTRKGIALTLDQWKQLKQQVRLYEV